VSKSRKLSFAECYLFCQKKNQLRISLILFLFLFVVKRDSSTTNRNGWKWSSRGDDKIMKLLITMLSALFFISCSAASQPNKSVIVDSAKIEKNKQTAIRNEVSEITRESQYLERIGRDMDSYRLAQDAESRRTCNALMEDRRREIADLEARIKNLPDNYNVQLTPIIADLNQCVSCSKKAMDSCVKTRASVNKAIKEIFP